MWGPRTVYHGKPIIYISYLYDQCGWTGYDDRVMVCDGV